MPNEKKHAQQILHNKNLLKESLFNRLNETSYSDWVITISFYILVHILEKELAKYKKHPISHQERLNQMLSNSHFSDELLQRYHEMYNLSIRARYKCGGINFLDAYRGKLLLKEIEDDLHLYY